MKTYLKRDYANEYLCAVDEELVKQQTIIPYVSLQHREELGL